MSSVRSFLSKTLVSASLLLPLTLAHAEIEPEPDSVYAAVCECVDPYNGVRNIPVMIRDFHDTHPDFQAYIGTDRGIVEETLGADGRPVYAHPEGRTPTTSGKEYFDQWYRDVPNVNQGISKTIQMIEIDPETGEPTAGTGFTVITLSFPLMMNYSATMAEIIIFTLRLRHI